jgi:cytochrome P450
LSSNTLIEKASEYNLLHPWLGRGLLTNTGDNWRSRRKLLTPAFHFKIIDEFIPIINRHSFTFVDRLKQTVGSTIDDICPYVTTCTLDIICETAMGVKINAQRDNNSEYVEAVNTLGESFNRRLFDISGWFDFIFYRTEYGQRFAKSLKVLHQFTRKIIRKRKQEILNKRTETSSLDEDSAVGRKKRKAFLDLLLEHHMSPESKLSEEDIREEVDTFMFEGMEENLISLSIYLRLNEMNEKNG